MTAIQAIAFVALLAVGSALFVVAAWVVAKPLGIAVAGFMCIHLARQVSNSNTQPPRGK